MLQSKNLQINQKLIKLALPRMEVKGKIEYLFGAIEVEVERNIMEKATKVVIIITEIVIHRLRTRMILKILIISNTQDIQEMEETTVVRILDQIIRVTRLNVVLNKFQRKGIMNPLITEKRSGQRTENLALIIIYINNNKF